MPYMLGRKPRSFNPRVPSMGALVAGKRLEAPPPNVDYTSGMSDDLGMMLNDQLGCCTASAVYHAVQVWSFNAINQMVTEPDSVVEKLYELADGYVPGDPSTDQGGNEQHVLTYLLKHGMPMGSGNPQRIAAFVEIDPRNTDDVKRGIFNNGLVYIGLSVPAYLMDGAPPAIWDVNPAADNSIVGGHAIILPGYDHYSTFNLISWGAKYRMTLAFFNQFVDEVYAIADMEWINAKGTTPGGLTLAQLEAQMAALRGD